MARSENEPNPAFFGVVSKLDRDATWLSGCIARSRHAPLRSAMPIGPALGTARSSAWHAGPRGLTRPRQPDDLQFSGSGRRRSALLDHVTIGVCDVERSKNFYDQALSPLGIVRLYEPKVRPSQVTGLARKPSFGSAKETPPRPVLTLPSLAATERPWMPSTWWPLRRGDEITDRRVCAPIITRTITEPSFSTRMATMSKQFATYL